MLTIMLDFVTDMLEEVLFMWESEFLRTLRLIDEDSPPYSTIIYFVILLPPPSALICIDY